MSDEDTIKESIELVERDVSFPRTVTMPLLLYRLCKKYGISISEATQEGALMMLRMNDAFMDNDGSIELAYKAANSKYKDKAQRFVDVINKMSVGSK